MKRKLSVLGALALLFVLGLGLFIKARNNAYHADRNRVAEAMMLTSGHEVALAFEKIESAVKGNPKANREVSDLKEQFQRRGDSIEGIEEFRELLAKSHLRISAGAKGQQKAGIDKAFGRLQHRARDRRDALRFKKQVEADAD